MAIGSEGRRSYGLFALAACCGAMAIGFCPTVAQAEKAATEPGPQAVLLIHGGCGVITRAEMKAGKLEPKYKAHLEASLLAGYEAWKNPDKTSVEVVEAAIMKLEDSPLFNAGHGAVFTREGRNELDASIMNGKTREAGAVASVTTVKNPITAARQVMEKSGHVLMVGDGAERFAEAAGCKIVPPHYFFTQFRWDQYQAALKEEAERQKHIEKAGKGAADSPEIKSRRKDGVLSRPVNRFGTVGAVALDKAGNLAAGTSTGGLTFKRHGRIGDSPIIGAGNYADNDSCAISSTGDGEFFLRAVAAHEISALVKYKNYSLAKAANEVILKTIKDFGGDGAVIVLNKKGESAMCYNTDGMYRGYVTAKGETHVFVYDEELK